MSKVKRTFHVFDEGLHEYSITDKLTKNGRVISLFYSEGEQWTSHTRGVFILKMTVTGDGAKFSNKINKMDYALLHSMRLLINYERETDTNGYNKIKSQVYETTQDRVNSQNFEV